MKIFKAMEVRVKYFEVKEMSEKKIFALVSSKLLHALIVILMFFVCFCAHILRVWNEFLPKLSKNYF